MEIECCTGGVRVLWIWATVLLFVPCILLFWSVWWLCAVVWLAACVIAFFSVKKYAQNLHLRLSGVELCFESGKMFHKVRRQPVHNLNSVEIIQTPLLKKANSCILILYSTNSIWVMPAVSIQHAEQISLLAGNGGKAK